MIEVTHHEDTLPAADLYAPGRILHDWDEEKIGLLLRKIHASLPDGGALIGAEQGLFRYDPASKAVLPIGGAETGRVSEMMDLPDEGTLIRAAVATM